MKFDSFMKMHIRTHTRSYEQRRQPWRKKWYKHIENVYVLERIKRLEKTKYSANSVYVCDCEKNKTTTTAVIIAPASSTVCKNVERFPGDGHIINNNNVTVTVAAMVIKSAWHWLL